MTLFQPTKQAPLPPVPTSGKSRPYIEISNPIPLRPAPPVYNGAKRAAPPRPRELPPALPRPSDTSPSPDPASIGSMSSLHDMLKVITIIAVFWFNYCLIPTCLGREAQDHVMTDKESEEKCFYDLSSFQLMM